LENPESQTLKSYKYFDLVMVLFVTVLIVSNIASSAKIVDWGVSLFGRLPLAFDAGTLLFPISYIFGDVLTEVYGYRRSRRVIWAGFAMLALTSLVFALVRVMPGEAGWEKVAGQTAYDQILGGISTGGIVLASLVAFFAGEFTNSYVLAKMKILTRGRWLWSRTIGSTLLGEGVDSLVFIGIATLAGVFPIDIFVTLVVTNYIFKVAIEVIMTPATYWIVAQLKKLESVDVYDWNTNFNPFAR
jgi:queuosine precursor transporter